MTADADQAAGRFRSHGASCAETAAMQRRRFAVGGSLSRALGGSSEQAMTNTNNAADIKAWMQWRQERKSFVTSRTGNLSLISYQKVGTRPEPVEQIPASVMLAETGDGVVLAADRAANIFVDGAPVNGEAFVGRLRSDGTPVISCGRYAFEVFSLDGTDYELRVYDEQAPNLADFDHIVTYDYDPEMVVQGDFRLFPEVDQMAWQFSRTEDTGHAKRVPGVINASLGGARYELLPFLDGAQLVIVFADLTTGTDSYAPGRFLRVSDDAESGHVVLDFNRAFIPPCGFSDYFSCPLPPAQNRLNVPVRAGEARVRWKRPKS